jgi:hypothetical protein
MTLSARARARGPLIALAALFLAPLGVAFWVYYGSSWRPAGRTNNGDLIEPAREVPTAGQDAKFLRGKWSLVYVGDGQCDADCRSTLYFGRQTWLGLGRLNSRVQQVFLVTGGAIDQAWLGREHPQLTSVDVAGDTAAPLRAAFPAEDHAHLLYIVDPLGNLMMSYDARKDPKGLREDLKKLLDLSHIG